MTDTEGAHIDPASLPSRRLVIEASIGLIPIIAYVLAFLYDFGYASYFEIPTMLISVSLTSFFVATGSMIFALALPIVIAQGIFIFIDPKSPFYPPTFGIAVSTTMVVATMILEKRVSLIALVTLLFLIVWFLVTPLVVYRGEGSFKERMVASQRVQRNAPDLPLLRPLRKLGFSFAFAAFYLVLLMLLAWTAGEAAAKTQERFLVTTGNRLIVLRVYGTIAEPPL